MKVNAIYKQYKDYEIAKKNSSNDCHKCLFYDALDSWWHRNGNVMKHVSASTNQSKEIVSNLESRA
jgi:hypothetical protein